MRFAINSREEVERYCAAIHHAVTTRQFLTEGGFVAAINTLRYQQALLENFPDAHHYISGRDGTLWPIEKWSN